MTEGPRMRLLDYEGFLDVSRRGCWDAETIPLDRDARGWRELAPEDRGRLEALLGGFCLAESAVAEALGPFVDEAGDPGRRACFLAQQAEEERHARAFDRIAHEVLRVPGGTPDARRRSLEPSAPPAVRELFCERLPAMASGLRDGSASLDAAVGLYHLVLEGVVFSAGQAALVTALDDPSVRPHLPGVRQIVGNVARDERWHIGFGARCLQDGDPPAEVRDRISREGEVAAAAWGSVLGAGDRDRALAVHRRRIGAAGLR